MVATGGATLSRLHMMQQQGPQAQEAIKRQTMSARGLSGSFSDCILISGPLVMKYQTNTGIPQFPGFRIRNYRFNAVYNSILFSSPLVLLLVTSIYAVFASTILFLCPHINRGMPVSLFCLCLLGLGKRGED